jgi:transcription initiation factor TFIIB
MATSQLRTGSHTDKCPRCFGAVRADSTEVVCRECGLVLEETPINHGPDWSRVSDDGPGTHSHPAKPSNRNHSDRGLGSDIPNSDAYGEMHTRKVTLHKHTQSGVKRDRTRRYATSEIHRMAVALELPDHLAARGKHVFRQLHRREDGIEGYDADTVAGACLLAACREADAGRVAADLAPVARAEARLIRRRMVWVGDVADVTLTPPCIPARVRVIGTRLDGAHKAVGQAVSRAADLDGTTISGAKPSTLAAALLYETGPWTQATIADAADVTTTALRKRWQALPESTDA